MKRGTWLAIGTLTLFSACIDDVEDVDLPEHDKGIVIEALLSPGEPAKAFVDQSQAIEEPLPNNFLEDVEVRLLEDETDKGLLQDSAQGIYHHTDHPKAGRRYEIQASHDQFETALGHTQIPQNVAIEQVEFEESALQNPNYEELHAVTIKFKDPPNVQNYYAVRGVMADTVRRERLNLVHFNPAVNFEFLDDVYLGDDAFDGQTYEFTVYIEGFYDPELIKEKFEIELRHITESYFLYARQLSRQESSGGVGPFSGEPAMSYSNVENGYGVVAGVNESVKSLE